MLSDGVAKYEAEQDVLVCLERKGDFFFWFLFQHMEHFPMQLCISISILYLDQSEQFLTAEDCGPVFSFPAEKDEKTLFWQSNHRNNK